MGTVPFCFARGIVAAMAKKVIVVDDLDGTPDAATIMFAVDGSTYEIDLCAKNAKIAEKALKPFVSAARKVKRR